MFSIDFFLLTVYITSVFQDSVIVICLTLKMHICSKRSDEVCLCFFTEQREDEVYEGICWETVTERLTCTKPFASRQITFTECCCLYGDAWGMDCALCPHKNTGINTQPFPMSTSHIYWCLFTSKSKSMLYWVPVYINVYIKCHIEQYTHSITMCTTPTVYSFYIVLV